MRKQLIKRYQEGGTTSKNGSPSQGQGNATLGKVNTDLKSLIPNGGFNFSNTSQTLGLTDTAKKALALNISNPSLFDKLNGFGQDALGALGGTSGAVGLASNIAGSILGKPDINSGAYETVDNVLGIAQNLPVVGLYAQFLKLGLNAINSLGAKKLLEVRKDQGVTDTLARSDGGYGNFRNLWDKASANSGKKVGFFTSADKYNKEIWNANALMTTLEGITERQHDNDVLTALMGDRWNERTMVDMNGGFGNISFGRLGLKIDILPKVHSILNTPKVVATLTEYETPIFKEGGKMNVIPEGSLHARLHHMENADGLTKKGIPVVSILEGELQAEIELNEIIFRLEVTKKIEKLMEDGSESAAIEAGKLLVKEIFENTDDRTGLIDTLKPEEKKLTTEDIVKNHLVFLLGGNIKPPFEEWYKTVPKDRNNTENYNLKRAYELAPWEELERWRTATPELLNDDKYHLKTFYWNDKGEGEFVKKNGHPTLIKELEAYFTNKDFREKYDLDMSGDYFKYIKKKK